MSEYKWRPKELIEARKKYCREQCISCESEDNVCEGCDTSLNFFAGSDAMLEALFRLAKDSPTGTFIIDSHIANAFEAEVNHAKQ